MRVLVQSSLILAISVLLENSAPLSVCRRVVLEEDTHQRVHHLSRCLGPYWLQDDELAKAALVVEDELVAVIFK